MPGDILVGEPMNYYLHRKFASVIDLNSELLEDLEGLLMAYQGPGNTGSTHDEKVLAAQEAISKARGQQ